MQIKIKSIGLADLGWIAAGQYGSVDIGYDQMHDVRLQSRFHKQFLELKIAHSAHHPRTGSRLEGPDERCPFFPQQMETSFLLPVDRLEGHVGENGKKDYYGTNEDPGRNTYPGFDGWFDRHVLSDKMGDKKKKTLTGLYSFKQVPLYRNKVSRPIAALKQNRVFSFV